MTEVGSMDQPNRRGVAYTRRAQEPARMPTIGGRASPVVVVGGAGFIGSNLSDSLLSEGNEVIILDNLSRKGVEQNLEWLKANHGNRVVSVVADIRDLSAIEPVFRDASSVFHFAAQTAVTTSLVDPVDDFETNARGTLNILEAVRRAGKNAPVIFSSTNKVYGNLSDLKLLTLDDRYIPAEEEIRDHGIGESRPLDFCTPYGCSKGVADQYVLDYAKSFRLPTAVLRMSCIYGPRQFGTEDQGWVAHFLLRALAGEPISVFGDGKQVRDILHVTDAVRAYRALMTNIAGLSGRVFNLGGGARNAVSIIGILRAIERMIGTALDINFHDWRDGDQLYFVADTRALQSALGWDQTIRWNEGVPQLAKWLMENRTPNPARKRASA